MRLTYLIAFVSQIGKKIFVIMNFLSAFKVISAYNNMIVEVVFVYMSGDDCFTISKDFRKLHADIICFLWRDRFSCLEGLNEMIEANPVRLVSKYFLRSKKGLVCHLGNAIVSRYICKLFVLVESF